ncbi:MAG: DUF5681 domain-containing protein [Roseiarcus sp.]
MSASNRPKRKPTGNYAVGYARPPKEHEFAPGQSGNKSGRPKGRPSIGEILLEEAARIAKIKVGDKVLHIDKDRATVRKLFDLGLQGNVVALRFVLSYLAQAQAALGSAAEPEAPLTEDELAVLKLMSMKSGK